MKRKRSFEIMVAPSVKDSKLGPVGVNNSVPSRLLELITQYGILIAITSHLCPKDLFALAATSIASYKTIFASPKSRFNLLHKMACDGEGVAMRKQYHTKSIYFSQYNCIEDLQCGTRDQTRIVQTQNCAACHHTTCDECRVHCVYQSIYQPPDAPDELPELSGFALLSPPEMRILTPAHLNLPGPDRAPLKPYHDQGFLASPLEYNTDAASESIDEILDFDLGSGSLQLSGSSTSQHPSAVIHAFWKISEDRKRTYCAECIEKLRNLRGISDHPKCHCTFRSRFLDRWLCLPCFKKETDTLGRFHRSTVPDTCICDQPFKALSPYPLCLWCSGEAEA